MRRLCHIVMVLATLAGALSAASPQEFLGYPIGARFTSHDRIVAYFDSLQKQSPLVRVTRYGETYEGRPLIYAAIGSAENMERLEQVRAGSLAMSSPDRTNRARAEELARTMPVIVWLAYGVHGDEASSSEAAMLLAGKLISGDAEAESVLRSAVVIIDPVQNPDGRERYIQNFRQSSGRVADVNADSIEHQEPWPGGRYNHYLIDLNRDWAFASQQETRARVDAYHAWRPQVFVDFHEMSHESSYFFPPVTDPINANIGGEIEKWFEIFGRANAAAFSERLWPFFVSERFDLFYPGYGDSWPSLRGAVGMTYEMAGGEVAGSAVRREDGTVLTLADRAQRHYVSGVVTLATAAAQRRELLLRTWDALQQKMTSGKVVYLIPPLGSNFEPAIRLLQEEGIEVRALDAPARLKVKPLDEGAGLTRDFPAGTAVISTAQPLGGLVQSLLEKTPQIPASFVEEQRKLVDADERDNFYDITSWSVPVSNNLEVYVSPSAITALSSVWKAPAAAEGFVPGRIGYLIDGADPNVYRAAGAMLAVDLEFSVSDIAFLRDARKFSRGTLLVQRANNRQELDAMLQKVVAETGARLVPLASGWEGELALGSSRLRHVREPRVGLIGGDGTSPNSFGSLWFTFDQDQKIPHTVLPLSRLRSIDLRQYRVLVFPDGEGYSGALRPAGIDKLKAWVRGGGTIVAIGDAAEFLRGKQVEMSKLRKWPGKSPEATPETPAAEEPEPQRYNEFRVPGAAFRTEPNERSFLTFGVQRPPDVLIRGADAIMPGAHKVDNVITIRRDAPLSSGFAWPESVERLKGAVYLAAEPYGSGQIITFADQPYYRLFWRGTLPLLMNAVLYSPSFPRE